MGDPTLESSSSKHIFAAPSKQLHRSAIETRWRTRGGGFTESLGGGDRRSMGVELLEASRGTMG